MSALPYGWSRERLLCLTSKIGSGATPRGGEKAYVEAGTPLIRSMNIHFDGLRRAGLAYIDDVQASALNGVTVESNDVLLNITGASIGRVTTAPAELAGARVNQHVCIIRTVDGIVPKFVAGYLASPDMQSFITEEHYGVTRPALTKEMVQEIKIPIPPQAEQRRIVTKIGMLSQRSKHANDHLSHLSRLIEKYRQSVLDKAFRADNFTDEQGWSKIPLEQVASVGTGATPKSGDPRYYDGSIPWITSGAVNQGRITRAQKSITELALKETNCKMFPAETIVMAMYGEGLTRGKVALLGIDAATNQAIAAIQIKSNQIGTSFLLWFLHSRYLHLRDQAAGGVQPNLNLGIVKRTEVPCPPMEIQEQVVAGIEVAMAWIDRIAAEATCARKLIEHLDQAILTKAFRGQLVPQDPNDEPASALLERIRGEKDGAVQPRRGRGRPPSVARA